LRFSQFEGRYTGFKKILADKWYIDELYDTIIVKPLNSLAGFLKSVVEKSGIDAVVNGTGRFVNYSSRQIRLLQSGQVGNYILFMVFIHHRFVFGILEPGNYCTVPAKKYFSRREEVT
jgi:NADH-quinone oxidoreductase subunit L